MNLENVATAPIEGCLASMNQILYFLKFKHFQEFLLFIIMLDKQNDVRFMTMTSAFLNDLEYFCLPFLLFYDFYWK